MIIPAAIWLAARFGVSKAIASVALVVALVAGTLAFLGGVYWKGYSSCVSKYELAAAREELRLKTEELEELKQAMQLGEEMAKESIEAERNNDEVSRTIVDAPDAGAPCGIGPVWLRQLDRLQ
jgi:hypothetical protein